MQTINAAVNSDNDVTKVVAATTAIPVEEAKASDDMDYRDFQFNVTDAVGVHLA